MYHLFINGHPIGLFICWKNIYLYLKQPDLKVNIAHADVYLPLGDYYPVCGSYRLFQNENGEWDKKIL